MVVEQHPSLFQIAFPDRRVNNVYFDTLDLHCFRDNVDGVNQRKKFRIRWYGESLQTLHEPTLEIKQKHNELGDKRNFKLPSQSLHLSTLTDLVSNTLNTHVPLQPTLINRYLRSYYESADRQFRITIDRRLEYKSALETLHSFQQFATDPDVIIEVKYESNMDEEAQYVFQNIPFRPTKSSKYVTGLFRTYY